jgi:hypothetical protein
MNGLILMPRVSKECVVFYSMINNSNQKEEKMTKKIRPSFSIIFCLVIAVLFISGCGGGGGESAPATANTPTPSEPPTSPPASTQHVPQISGLQYSPRSTTQNQGNGAVTITATINFTDQGGDVKTAVANRYNDQGVLLGTSTGPLSNLSGVTSGIATAAGDISTTDVGVFTIEIYIIDAAGNSSNKLTGTFTVTAPVPPPAPASDALIGNFKFAYKIIDTFTNRITMNKNTNTKTSEGTDFYSGYDADYPSVTYAGGGLYPSISQYIISIVPLYSSPYRQSYTFSINADNTLPGCYRLSADSGVTWSPCYSFILPASHKTPLGSWEMSMESPNNPIDINKVFEKQMDEDLEVQAQQTESVSPVDADVISKINELTAIMERDR